MGAEEIDVILASPVPPGIERSVPGILEQVMRVLDIMSSEILKDDLEAMNDTFGKVKIRLFMPEESLTSNSLDFTPEKLKIMYDKGKQVKTQVKWL